VRQPWIQITCLCAMALGFAVLVPATKAQSQDPCEQIKTACINAGFVQGGASTGNGLVRDCVDPIVQGTPQRRKATKPLPQVDPALVAACKVQNTNVEESKTAANSSTQPANPAVPAPNATPITPADSSKHPNIVFVLTDDLAMNLLQYMPHVLEMQKQGVTFANYFVTDSLCCPSRSSIFTGRYPHSTGIFKNHGEDGGYLAFVGRGLEHTTFATTLSSSGYRTALMGKYLNDYLPERHPVAPGWATWAVGGYAYKEFRYSLNEDGKVVSYGTNSADYLTDVVSKLAVNFIKQARGQAFLIEVATFAPHKPYVPAPRDANAFPGLRAPRTPAYNAAPAADTPKWLSRRPALTGAEMAMIDDAFRKRAQSVLAVDALIGALQAAVAAIGQEKNTYFVFSSDNGLHMGDFRLMPGKLTAYDTDIHVPLVITGPGVPAGVSVGEIVENIDLCSTFTELTGAAPLPNVDGRSLVPLLQGQKPTDWRNATLVEHRGARQAREDPDAQDKRSGYLPSYEAIRTLNSLYVEYADGDKEYHDLAADPYEVNNTFSSLPAEQKAALHAAVVAIQNCHGAESCWAAQHPAPVGRSTAHP
jgi:N-acetylglucosamine-6-sulfatase